ncbi:hypothetical protein NP233_g800 [Leucocoprinus birnbaumii]|uniref:SH3 domain-containing protein n=1 Tax=Leucocoprinus birnbaumii TaxID=56174 RepID=A0AAD5YVG4_9AGAR|nr:hypothetical protein NP233_g800 [Leucocoprinus birnbaumii]
MKFNTPLPQSLLKECDKAAKIFQSFVDSRNNGLDGVIPRSVLQNAKGFAIFTVAKAGFVFSARAGSGVVIAKMDNGKWTAPSAIGTAGIGFGGQAGAEVTDFLVVLNTRAAIRSFMAAGSLQLGGNLSIALGPLGRNGEAMGTMSTGGKMAAMYSYSKTRGLFGGISIEGSVIVERQDANTQAYNSPVTVKMLLGGAVDPPPWAEGLIKTLENCTGMPGQRDWIHDGFNRSPDQAYAFASPSPQATPSPRTQSRRPSFLKRKKSDKQAFPPSHWGVDNNGDSYFPEVPRQGYGFDRAPSNFDTQFDSGLERRMTFSSRSNSTLAPQARNQFETDPDDPFDNSNAVEVATSTNRGHTPRAVSLGGNFKYSNSNDSSLPASRFRSQPTYNTAEDDENAITNSSPFVDSKKRHSYIQSKPELIRSLEPGEGVARAIALYDFKAVEEGDLSFNKGEIIIITKKSDSTDDWWTGKVNNKEGIFPANFVELA